MAKVETKLINASLPRRRSIVRFPRRRRLQKRALCLSIVDMRVTEAKRSCAHLFLICK